MKPDKFIGIMLITLLLSCEKEEQVDQKIGEVVFESNQQIMNSVFITDVFIDGNKIGSLNDKLESKIKVGVHDYEIRIYSFNGETGKKLKGRIIVKENKTCEVFIDFKKYNSWI